MRTFCWINLGIAVVAFAVALGYADATPSRTPTLLLVITTSGFTFSLFVLISSYVVVSALEEERERCAKQGEYIKRYRGEAAAMEEDLAAFNAIEDSVGATNDQPLEDHVAEMMEDRRTLQTVRTVLGLSERDDIVAAVTNLKGTTVAQPESAELPVEPGV